MSELQDGRFRIVVGFDGSEGARRALIWAADEARSRAASLEVVWAWRPGEFGSEEEQVAIAQKRVDDGVTEVLGADHGLRIETRSQAGHAAKVLLDHATGSDMLVVGSRGHGEFTGILLGSVGLHVAIQADAPIVVIVRR